MAGRKINDHSAWMGSRGKEYPLPMESKMKAEKDSAGDGHIMDYPDTSEHIHRDQEHSVAKAKSKPMKPGYRY